MRRRVLCTLSLSLLLAAAPAQAGVFLAFTPDPARAGVPVSGGTGEGVNCNTEPGLARGLLGGSSSGPCHVGQIGSASEADAFAGQTSAETTALFESDELRDALTTGGHAMLVAHYQTDANATIADQEIPTDLDYELREKHVAGHSTVIASGTAFRMMPGGGRGVATFSVPAHTLSSGSRLQVLLMSTGAPDAQVLFGGPYGDAGITLETGNASNALPGVATAGASGGSMTMLHLLLLGFAALALRPRGTPQRHPRVRANSFMYSTSAFTPASGIAL